MMVDYFTPICNVCIVCPRHFTIYQIDKTTSYICQNIYLHNVFDYSLTKLHIFYLINRDKPRYKAIKPLPEAYTLVTPCNFPNSTTFSNMIPNNILTQSDTAEGVWLDKVSAVCQRDEATAADIDNISW